MIAYVDIGDRKLQASELLFHSEDQYFKIEEIVIQNVDQAVLLSFFTDEDTGLIEPFFILMNKNTMEGLDMSSAPIGEMLIIGDDHGSMD